MDSEQEQFMTVERILKMRESIMLKEACEEFGWTKSKFFYWLKKYTKVHEIPMQSEPEEKTAFRKAWEMSTTRP